MASHAKSPSQGRLISFDSASWLSGETTVYVITCHQGRVRIPRLYL